MSTPELRPPRTTPNLGLPLPGDASPADYVTATGAIIDRLDQVAAQISQVGMTRIADQRLSAAAGNINFPNIPQTFSHLQLILKTRAAGANSALPWVHTYLRFNSDATASYDWQTLAGTGQTVEAGVNLSQPWGYVARVGGSAGDGAFSTVRIDIADYAALVRKEYMAQAGAVRTSDSVGLSAALTTGYWRSEPAINTITLYISGDSGLTQFVAGTRATLYALA